MWLWGLKLWCEFWLKLRKKRSIISLFREKKIDGTMKMRRLQRESKSSALKTRDASRLDVGRTKKSLGKSNSKWSNVCKISSKEREF